ncbi:hypothetical protein IAF53_20255, partial [Acinetobacter baumannii]|nr:hypothetical protein [Acinetobacter baumannii]
SKYANKEGTAKVGGYSVFNIGAAYKTNFAGHDTTFRFNIDNLSINNMVKPKMSA